MIEVSASEIAGLLIVTLPIVILVLLEKFKKKGKSMAPGSENDPNTVNIRAEKKSPSA